MGLLYNSQFLIEIEFRKIYLTGVQTQCSFEIIPIAFGLQPVRRRYFNFPCAIVNPHNLTSTAGQADVAYLIVVRVRY